MAIQVNVELLFVEMVGVVVERTVEEGLLVRTQLVEGIDGVADIARGDGCFGNFQQSGVGE